MTQEWVTVPLSNLKFGTLMEIANDMGCDEEMPTPHIDERLFDRREKSKEEWKDILENSERLQKQSEKEWDEYEKNIYQWLKNNDFIEEVTYEE